MPFLAPLVPLLINFAIGAAVSLVLGVVQNLLLGKKQPKRQVVGFDDRNNTDLGALDPQDIPFGELRKGGTIVYKRSTIDKQNLWVVVILAGCRIEAIEELWLGNEAMVVDDGDGSVSSGSYAGKVFCWKHLGDDDQTVDLNLKAAFGDDWTDAHRLRGLAYVVLKFVADATLFPGGAVPNISFNIRGCNQILDPRTGLTGYTDNPILCARHYLLNTRFGMKVPATLADDAALIAEANACDDMMAVPSRKDLAYPKHTATFTAATSDILTLTGTVFFYGREAARGLRFNDPVRVSSSGTLPGGLSAGVTYYARPLSLTTLKLATSKTATTFVDITSIGTGTHTLLLQVYRLTLAGDRARFNGNVDDRLLLEVGSAGSREMPTTFKTGWKCQVRKRTAAAVLPAPLAENTDYYAIRVGDTQVKLATSMSNAEAGTAINLTTAGSTTALNEIVFTAPAGRVTVGVTDSVFGFAFIDEHRIQTGDAVTIVLLTGTLPLGVEAKTYYAIRVSATQIRIATSRLNALRNKYVIFGEWTGSSQEIYVDRNPVLDMKGLPTGTKVRLSFPNYTLPTGVATGVDYYVINRGRDTIDLAATLADAIAGNPLLITDGGVAGSGDPGWVNVDTFAERRYVCSGVLATDQTHGAVLGAVLSSCAGGYVPPGDAWRLYCGRWRVPLTTLDPDLVRSGGALTLQTRLPRRDAVNVVTGTYVSSVNFDEPADFPAYVDDEAIAEDGGAKFETSLHLAFTGSKWTAWRIAAITGERSRYQRTLSWPGDLAIEDLAPFDTFDAELPAGLGEAGIIYEVQSKKWSIEVPEDGEGPIPAIDLVARETSPFIYIDLTRSDANTA